MRLFFALSVADNVISELATLSRNLDKPWHPIKADQMHITLAFLGDIPEDNLKTILRIGKEAAGLVQSFLIQLSETGVFPNAEEPRVLFASVDRTEELTALHLAITGRLENYNDIFPFRPHVTLARCRRPGAKFIKKNINLTWKANSLKLFKSELTSHGPLHEIVDQWMFHPEPFELI